MKALAVLLEQRLPLALAFALGFSLSSCEQPLRQEAERLPPRVARPAAAPPASDERQQRFRHELELHPRPSPERTALVQAQLADARFSANAAMHAWATFDPSLGYNAYGFLLQLEDLAIVPTIEQPLPSTPDAAAKALLLVSEGEGNLRRKLLLRIKALLDDTRELPAAPGQTGSPHRVCDEAYRTLRRLVRFPEPEFKQPLNVKSFFASSPTARSALIERARRTATWQRIVDPSSDAEDKPSKPSPPAGARPQARPKLRPME